MISKMLRQGKKHKLAAVAIVLVIAGAGYWGYGKIFSDDGIVRYVSAQVQNGTLIVSISGSGQVSASNQVDVKPKVSGDVIYIGVKNDQEVQAGTLMAQLDSRDAQKAVRDAEVNLESVKLDLEKMKGIKTEEGFIRGIKEKAADDLKKAYEDGFNTATNAFLDLPTVMAGLHDLLFSSSVTGSNQENIDYYADSVKSYDPKALQYKDDVRKTYQTAKSAYDKNFDSYKSASRFSDRGAIESLIDESYETTKDIAEAIKSANSLIQFYKDKLAERNLKPNAISDTHLSTLNTYTSKTNSHLLNLLSIKNAIQNNKEALAGTDFDIADQEIKVTQASNALLDAKEKLADYFVRVPFDGVVAKVSAKKGDSASASTIIATIITKQRIAEISLNEVDMAKVKVGQKVTITFDAIEGLSLTGEVAEIDSVGTITQGVVNYGVKIGFDTQDERVKPGMSVSAAIITDVRPNVLVVPNSAVKQQNNMAYVEMFAGETQTPRQQTVQAGLSNDTMTEIVSGLNEGDQIVTQTITANASQSQTQQSTGLRIPGITGGGQMRMR